jgi:hypothetical protein
MKTIEITERLKEINPYQLLETNISFLLKSLLDDFDQTMDQANFDHSYKQITYHLVNRYKFLSWGEIIHVFKEITSGNTEMKKVSVVNIMNCFSDYQKKKIEHNRFEIEKRENEIIKNMADMNKTPFGQAINFRTVMREKGIHSWDNIPLKEIAEKIANGEIKYYKEKKQ